MINRHLFSKYFRIFLALIVLTGFIRNTNAQKKISFSGMEWFVRSGGGGPGPNQWSDDTASVQVDAQGNLHMKIRREGGTWYCSEIYALKSYGYGEYKFEVSSDLEHYDPKVVVGLFTYETDDKEIDIEFARWGDLNGLPGWYTVQPYPYNSTNQSGFELGLSGQPSRHLFKWSSDSIVFQSYRPFVLTVPPMDSLIHKWTYTGTHNPPVGNERLHINFWLFQGQAPSNLKDAELVISSVHVPSTASSGTLRLVNTEILLYPNPAHNLLGINYPVTANPKISLLSITGRLICSDIHLNNAGFIDISTLENGMYLLCIQDEMNTIFKKFIKI
ncbi:MAG: T9SS type A sorting domain-containing protein [Bacteroidetes bacterium]|nr:T9SS type A sorting domain-containing protein [Bacteroidota bacterium]